MAVTTPDNIVTPDDGDDYALVQDLAAMADSVQDAITEWKNYGIGTDAERLALTSSSNPPLKEGLLWYSTDTDVFWVRVDGGWAAGSMVTGALSGGTNVDYSATRLRRVGKRNVLQGRIEKTSGSFSTNEAVAGLPAGTFPAAEVVAPIVLMTSGFTATVGVCVVGIDGVIRVNYTGISNQVYAHVDLVWDS